MIHILYGIFYLNIKGRWEFPGFPVVRTQRFHSQGSIPGQGTVILQAAQHGQKKKKLMEGKHLFPLTRFSSIIIMYICRTFFILLINGTFTWLLYLVLKVIVSPFYR